MFSDQIQDNELDDILEKARIIFEPPEKKKTPFRTPENEQYLRNKIRNDWKPQESDEKYVELNSFQWYKLNKFIPLHQIAPLDHVDEKEFVGKDIRKLTKKKKVRKKENETLSTIKIRVFPTQKQRETFEIWAGVQRFDYNRIIEVMTRHPFYLEEQSDESFVFKPTPLVLLFNALKFFPGSKTCSYFENDYACSNDPENDKWFCQIHKDHKPQLPEDFEFPSLNHIQIRNWLESLSFERNPFQNPFDEQEYVFI